MSPAWTALQLIGMTAMLLAILLDLRQARKWSRLLREDEARWRLLARQVAGGPSEPAARVRPVNSACWEILRVERLGRDEVEWPEALLTLRPDGRYLVAPIGPEGAPRAGDARIVETVHQAILFARERRRRPTADPS